MSKDNNKSTKTKAPKEQPKAPQAAAPKVSLDPAYIGRITGTLLAICAAVALYSAVSGGETIGWAVQTTANGSQGPITMVVGVDTAGAVTGVSVIKHSETPNIGTKVVADQNVLDRFVGLTHENGEVTINTGSNSVDGVSGATYSSRGVAAGVNAALSAVAGLS